MLELTLVRCLIEVPVLGLLTNVLVFHWFVASCGSQPCTFNKTKTLPTPTLNCFHSHGQLTQTCPALAIKTATILLVSKD